jgi:hypothetical protein
MLEAPDEVANQLMAEVGLPFFVMLVRLGPRDDERWRILVTGSLEAWRRDGDMARMAVAKALLVTCHPVMMQNTELLFLEDWER